MGSSGPARVRVERGIYRQRNGKYAVCWRHAGRLRFRTAGFDLAAARRGVALIAATREGKVPASPRLRFETVAGWWLDSLHTGGFECARSGEGSIGLVTLRSTAGRATARRARRGQRVLRASRSWPYAAK